tara:strand:+ start:7736 stop:9163 length:1428 start_codon:yes stop_codon:yes gene_type:complete
MLTGSIKKVCCIGAGYVGGPSMAVFADNCKNIQFTVVDINKDRISAWNDDDFKKLPIFEPGLDQIIARTRGKNLFFSTEIKKSISEADMIFLSVNTPIKISGLGAGKASDLKFIEASARLVAEEARGFTIVVEKSTLPVKTAETIKSILFSSQTIKNDIQIDRKFSVLSNPEFLAEGTAINDLENPDRVLIGGDDDDSIEALSSIYENWIQKDKIIKTNLWSSELSKLAANAFLAQRISSINSMSAFCEVTGANINEVSNAIGTDSRIGSKFLSSGPGFGGSCFKKDILNLVYLCSFYGLDEVSNYWEQVILLNDWQQKRISHLIIQNLFGTLAEKKIGILGFSFKANTNDTRQSPAIKICKDLLEEGAELSIYDPKVSMETINLELTNTSISQDESKFSNEKITVCESIDEVAVNADAIVLITDWPLFKNINWDTISKLMRKPSWVFDTRNCIDDVQCLKANINVWKLGVGILR